MADYGVDIDYGGSGGVDVLYDHPYPTAGSGNGKGKGVDAKQTRRDKNQTNGGGGKFGKHVDFENVFDPFDRDDEDLREFFDEESLSEGKADDWEKPSLFHDPSKVRKNNSTKKTDDSYA